MLALGLVACAPEWVSPSYEPTAREHAIRAAARDHQCPTDRVRLRCDATTTRSPNHGKLAVYDDGVVGTLVDEVPHWEFELDVCGHVRRYSNEGATSGRGPTFIEQHRRCERGVCASVDPPCRNAATGMWWPVEAAGPPPVCQDAPVDDRITVAVEARRVEVVFENASTRRHLRWFGASCREPSLLVSVDGRWFSLCAELGRQDHPIEPGETHRIASGLALGPGTHRVTAFHLEPNRELGASCRRSRTSAVTVRGIPLSWIDL